MQKFVRRGHVADQGQDWFQSLLLSRGVDTPGKARDFLNPSLDQLLDPALLPGALDAARVLCRLKAQHARVAVYGDYDVDGVCAAAILEEALVRYGLDAFVYIPDRHEEGYGLNVQAVEKLAGECQAIITVDCGIVSTREVARARELGLQVIVTDHHRPGDVLPPADAVVCPLLGNYPFPALCGAGVAWKLCWLLCGLAFARGRLDLCALATVADVVSLTGENRVLVAEGLKAVAMSHRPGLQAICRLAGLDQRKVKSGSIAFQIAPRLNAAGRLESAMDAYRLLRTEDEQEASALATRLELLNTRRREEQTLVIAQAEDQVKTMDLTACSAIVVLGEGWDSGVVGLSAGKLAEKYAYPTVVLTRVPGEETCVGSARSACKVDIYQALKDCGDIFLRFGGHSAAAGMTLKCADVPLLRKRLSDNVRAQLQGRAPVQVVEYDDCMRLEDVTRETVETMARLEPFGMGNPAPQFLFEGVECAALRAVGTGGAHLKCTFRQDGHMRDGIFFGGGAWSKAPQGLVRLVGVPVINAFQGRVSAECQVKAMQIQSLSDDPERELCAVLQDLRLCAENINEFAPLPGFSAVQDVPAAWADAPQGTLLLCRKAETARTMLAKYPQLHLVCGSAEDSRAYSAVGWCVTAWSAHYTRVVLCDGLLCPEEGYLLQKQHPGTIFAVQESHGAEELLQVLRISKDELREVYKSLRATGGGEASAQAESMGMPLGRMLCAMEILSQMGLVQWTQTPLGARLLPSRKCEPEESPLYRLLWRA